MPTPKENGLQEQAGSNKTNNNPHSNNTKKFPPFGKQLDELRQKGLVPVLRVIVSTDWSLGAAYPRIVIPKDANLRSFNFAIWLDYMFRLCTMPERLSLLAT